MFDIKHHDRETFGITREQAEALGYPEDLIAEAEARAHKGEVSAECRRRIYGYATAEAQINMAITAAVIAGKAASSRTEQEKAVLAAITGAREWVEAMRAAYRDMPVGANYRSDDAWPALDGAILEIVAEF